MGKEVLGLLGINKLRLAHGGHNTREQGVCLMEAVAWFADEPHSDHPACVDVVLGAFGRRLNDRWNDEERQQLVDLIPQLVGTAQTAEVSMKRAYKLVDGVIRTVLPLILATRWPEHADVCKKLDPIVDAQTADAARKVCRSVAAWLDAYTAHAAYAADAADAAATYAADAAAHAAHAAYAADAADAAASAADAADYANNRKTVVEATLIVFHDAIHMDCK